MKFLKKYFLQTWKKYLVVLSIGFAIVILNLALNGFDNSINYINGFFIAGFALLCIGGLSVLSYLGAYDFFSYAFYRKKARLDYMEYIQQKETKRKNGALPYTSYFVLGGILVLISFIIQSIL